jgi:hypothetical protein
LGGKCLTYIGTEGIGGLITAVFSYLIWLIQKNITTKSERKRVAYFYLVKICEILAARRAVEFVFKNELADLKKKIGEEKHALHMLCAGFSKLMNENIENVSESNRALISNVGNIIRQAYTNKQECFGFKIDDEIVSKFPQPAILKYHFFISYIRQLQNHLEVWIVSLDKFNFIVFTPEFLYGQIECVKNMYKSAESLIDSLAQESGIKKNEVNDIVQNQFKEFSIKGLEAQYNKKITDIFSEVLNKPNKEQEIKNDLDGNSHSREIYGKEKG